MNENIAGSMFQDKQSNSLVPNTSNHALLQSEERFRLLVDAVKDYAIYILDHEGKIASWNTGAERLLGYSAHEVIGRKSSLFYTLEDLEANKLEFELRVASKEGRFQEEGFRVRKDGSRFFAEVVVTAIQSSFGHITGFAKIIRDITERKNFESELAKSEERNRLILNGVNDYAIFMLDPHGRVASWNSGAQKIKGYEASEVIGQHFSLFYPAEAINSGYPQRELEVATRDGRYEEEGWRVRKDGSRFLAHVVLSALKDENGSLRGFSKVTRDITDRRHASEALKASEERFRLLVEGVKDYGIFMLDPEGRVSSWNAGAAKISGYRSDEIIGRHFSKFYTLEDIQTGHPTRELEIAKREGRHEEEGWRLRKNGSKFWASIIITALWDRSGQLVGFSKVTRDVTDRYLKDQAQEFLNRSSRLLVESLDYERTLAEVSRVAVETIASWAVFHVKLPSGKFKQIRASHANAKLSKWINAPNEFPVRSNGRFGFETVIRKGEAIFIPQSDGRIMLEAANDSHHLEILRNIGFDSYICVPLTARGEVFGSISLATGSTNDRHLTEYDFDVVKEMARRVALAVDNALLFANAEAASQAKDNFLATLSHELRTPLNVISGWVQTLKAKDLDPETYQEAIEALDRNSQVQARLINDLLDVSRIIAGKLTLEVQPLDLNRQVRSAVESFQIQAKQKSILLSVETPESSVPVNGDAQRLQQVVSNLVSNALKFTPAGGSIAVTVEKTDTSARILVRDTGAGIDRGFLPHVFESFKQEDSSTTRSSGGLGLGLSIVRSLASLHDGTVEAFSEGRGKGAVFTVRLPRLTGVNAQDLFERGEKEMADKSIIEDTPLEGVHVLIVDDSPDVLHLIRHWLSGCGAKVTTATSAKEAMEALTDHRPDVLLSDIGMPTEDGFSFIKKVRKLSEKEGGHIPAAALTAYAREEEGMKAIRAGFNMHLAKPVTKTALLNAIFELSSMNGPGRGKRTQTMEIGR